MNNLEFKLRGYFGYGYNTVEKLIKEQSLQAKVQLSKVFETFVFSKQYFYACCSMLCSQKEIDLEFFEIVSKKMKKDKCFSDTDLENVDFTDDMLLSLLSMTSKLKDPTQAGNTIVLKTSTGTPQNLTFEGCQVKQVSGKGIIVTKGEEFLNITNTDNSMSFINKTRNEQVCIEIGKDFKINNLSLHSKSTFDNGYVNDLECSSSSKFHGKINGDIEASSAAEVSGSINSKASNIEASSSAVVKLVGNCNNVNIEASSASRIDLSQCYVENCIVEASSSAKVVICSSESLSGEASSGASIIQHGSAHPNMSYSSGATFSFGRGCANPQKSSLPKNKIDKKRSIC